MTVRTVLSSAARIALGSVQHVAGGKTPPTAYRGMVQLFCATGGMSNDMMSSIISGIHRPYDMTDAKGVLGDLNPQDVKAIAGELAEKGYHVFKNRLDVEVCDRLLRFGSEAPCVELAMDSKVKGDVVVASFPRKMPRAVRYNFQEEVLINNHDVQKIMADRSILAVAQSYLRAPPIVDVVAMWWSTAVSKTPDKQAAQFWHFDMDRIKWLKFFVYLTDVGEENGPHSFVEGSHRRGGIPYDLLQKGYSRLTDDEVNAHYGARKFIEFTAPRGTILAEDTRGLHKGKHVIAGDRLMLQIQFSNSLFGGYYPPSSFNSDIDPALREMTARFPRVYSNYKGARTAQ